MPFEYLDQAATDSGKFEYLDDGSSFLEKTASNIIPDLGNVVKGAAGMVKEGAYDMPKRAIESGVEVAGGTPYSETPSGERDTQLVNTAPEQAKEMARPVTDFKNYTQEHPVQQAMNAAALFGLGKGAMGGEDIPKVPPSEPPPPAGELPPPAGPAGPATEIPQAPKAPPSALPEGISDLIKKYSGKTAEAVPDNVKDYVKKASDAPLNRGTLSQYADKSARGMTMKVLGASPGQLRKIGEANANKLADWAMDKDIVNLKTGDIGVAQKIDKINSDAGQVVGDMRDLAGQRGATHDVGALMEKIHSKLGDKFESGMESGGKGSYQKALESVAKTPGTPKSIAKLVTDLFHKAKEENIAAGILKLGAPKGPYADVARVLRSENEALLAEKLTPKELNVYHNALEDYGASTQLNQFRQMKWSKDMGGRLPPGMGLARGALQKGLDTVGYRGLAQIQKGVAKWLSENPNATTTPKELFRHYVDESADAMDEIGEGVH
jgi:hypothetical protein